MRALIILLALLLASCGGGQLSAPVNKEQGGGQPQYKVEAPAPAPAPPPPPPAMAAPRAPSSSYYHRQEELDLSLGSGRTEKEKARRPAPAPRSETITREEIESGGYQRHLDIDRLVVPPSAAYNPGMIPKVSPDDVINQLSLASMAFSIPDKVNIEEHIKAQLLIKPGTTPETLEAELTVKGQKSSTKILISKIVNAKLKAPGFEITEITPSKQAISAVETTEWTWELRPTKEGKFDVMLEISAIVQVDNMKSERHIKTFEKNVVVTVTPKQKAMTLLEKHGDWLWSGLAVPIGLWLWKWWKRRRRKTAP